MSDDLKHECAVAMVVLRKPVPAEAGDFGGAKLSLLLEKQHNRGQDGAGAAILSAHPEPGESPYWLYKSASSTPLVDLLAAIGKRLVISHRATESQRDAGNDSTLCASVPPCERIFLGHLRYATFGKNDAAFCHPFVHQASELEHTLLLAGNFNLTNTADLFETYSRQGEFPTSKADGYLLCEMVAHELANGKDLAASLSSALADADGAWTLCGMTGDGWAFATRDPFGIRPGYCLINDDVVVVASERPAIQAAFNVPPEAVTELPPGSALLVSPDGNVSSSLVTRHCARRARSSLVTPHPCAFERIYFSRANDADIHRERKALGAALLPQILNAADAPLEDIFFSYIPNSARIAFHGLLEELFANAFSSGIHNHVNPVNPVKNLPRFGEIAVKDAKFRTFIADAAARSEFYKHVYDVTYGLVRPGRDTLVVLDDSIVRGNTMRNAILPMLDRLGPKRIVIASSAPPIRYPDCYGIDMSTLGELVAFRALVNLLGGRDALSRALARESASLPELYARFTDEEHCAEIARLLTPSGMNAEVKVVYQTVEALRKSLQPSPIHSNSQLSTLNSQLSVGDWYFTGDYPTPGGYKVLRKALQNYLDCKSERSY